VPCGSRIATARVSAPEPNDKFRKAITPHNIVERWGLDSTERGIRSNLSNAVIVLQHDPQFEPNQLWYDEFLDRVLTRDEQGRMREWHDTDDARFAVYLQQVIGMTSIAESIAASAVRFVASQRARHCVREWMRSLIWDGTDRIAHALEEFWGVELTPNQPSDYVRAVSANLFIGMVARVMRPGCQLDTMPIFEGAQGIGKSKSLRLLGGDHYMLAAESVTSKDFYQGIRGKMLVEIGELDAMSKADRERTKIAISTPTDRYRDSYGRRAMDHPRQCLFVGTTNRNDYGNDETGLRRLWPVRCTEVDCPGIARWREQWIAEAVAKFDAGATWWEVPASAADVQRERQHEDAWTPTVLAYVEFKDDTTSADVLTNSALKMRESDITRTEQNRVSAILQANGWKRQTVRWNGKPTMGFKNYA
jgi:predicted P-loop ATPase